MPFAVVLKRSAEKEVASLDVRVQGRILEALATLAENPRPPGAQKLRGPYDLWRIRVGDYRILYRVEENVLKVYVVRVSHRREVYRRLDPLLD